MTRILDLETNRAYELNDIPNEVEDLRFCVLDNSDPKNPDYFFIPLIFFFAISFSTRFSSCCMRSCFGFTHRRNFNKNAS